MALSKRTVLATLVVVAWGSSLVWLGIRQTGQSDAARIASQASLRLAPNDAWFRVMAGATQIGYAGITLDTLPDGSYRLQETQALELPHAASLIRTIRSTDIYLGEGLGLDSMISHLVRPGERLEYRITTARGGWQVLLTVDGVQTVGRLELVGRGRDAAPVLAVPIQVVPLRLALVGALAAGNGRTLAVGGGWPPSGWLTDVAVGSDSVVIYADSSDIAPDRGIWVPATMDTANGRGLVVESPESIVGLMVDPRGTVLGIQYPLGVTWVREEFNIARFNFRGGLADSSDVLHRALPVVARQRGPIASGDSMATWTVTRRDGSMADITVLAGGRQDTAQGRLVVGAPLAQRVRLGRTEPADPMIQEGDSLVAAFAASIAEPYDRRDLERVATAIASRVRLDTTRSAAADAAGALRTGRALPEGLSRLMVAVLRHHGWRGRVAFGVRPAGDTLYTHAWVESFSPQRQIWRAIDPATGRAMPADWIRVAWAGSTLPELMLPIVADVRFTPVAPAAGQGARP
jgi:hypothetical protein